MTRIYPRRRNGAALLALVVVLSLLAAVLATIAWQIVANRRAVTRREQQRQAVWLARAGAEVAAQKLLDDPDNYRGETAEPLPASKVEVTVRRAQDVFEVVSTARYPADAPRASVRTVTRRFRRSVEGGTARLEALPPPPEGPPDAEGK